MSGFCALGALAYGLCSYRLLFGRWPFGLLNRTEYYASSRELDDAGWVAGAPSTDAVCREVARATADYHTEVYAVEVGIDEHGRPLPPAVVFSDTPEPPVPNLRPAVREDYAEWLAGYVERGGRVTHEYPYPMHRNGSRFVEFWVTTGDVVLPPLYGADRVKVIVRPPHQVLTHGLGHSLLFYLDGFHQQGITEVPAYSDVSASSRRPDA